MTTREQIELNVAFLAHLEEERQRSGDPALGAATERDIISRALDALEQDILFDPGAIEPMLVPVRMRYGGRILH
jgi:hypothetical protein